MAVKTRIASLDSGVKRSDRIMAAAMSSFILVTLVVWIALKEEYAKYVLYTLPVTMTATYLVMNGGRVKLHRPAVTALALYVTCAVVSMVLNGWYDFLAVRDLMIICGYLLLFTLWFRCPISIVDASMFTLAVGMLVEAATEGIGEEVSLFGSEGILESTLAFPIGLVVIFYLHYRQWGRALIASVWLFLAFKRITFLAVALAVGFDILIAGFVRPGAARAMACVIVVVLSVISLFSTQIFELVAATLQIQNTSANSISLGRYEMATQLWTRLAGNPLSTWLIGSGPASADALLTAKLGSPTANNPHNDWLKILFDYGIVGFVAMHVVLVRLLCEHRLGILLYLYGAVVMMTDNIFIYMFYHPFVLLLISAARGESGQASRGMQRATRHA